MRRIFGILTRKDVIFYIIHFSQRIYTIYVDLYIYRSQCNAVKAILYSFLPQLGLTLASFPRNTKDFLEKYRFICQEKRFSRQLPPFFVLEILNHLYVCKKVANPVGEQVTILKSSLVITEVRFKGFMTIV